MTGKRDATEADNPQRTVLGLFPETRALFKRLGLLLLGEVALLAAGFAFYLILHGLVFTLLLFARYWKPAFAIVARAFPPGTWPREFVPVPLTWWRALLFMPNLALRVAMIGVGIWILLTTGLCGQNIICLQAR